MLLCISTTYNLVIELTRKKLIINRDDILNLWSINGPSEKKRDYTMLWFVEQYLHSTGIAIATTKTSKVCFCMLPNTFGGERFTCKECGKKRHIYCNKKGTRKRVCTVCTIKPDYLLMYKKVDYNSQLIYHKNNHKNNNNKNNSNNNNNNNTNKHSH